MGYTQHYPEPNLKRVRLSDKGTLNGNIQRIMRWGDIAEACQSRYGCPQNILLGMMGRESYGDPVQPNAGGDGGLGLRHIQPSNTLRYGLRMITPSGRLVDHVQGKKIFEAIHQERYDLKELIKYDDRFHPIMGIDVAARMMCDLFSETRNWDRALERYAGRASYDSWVGTIAKSLKDPKIMQKVRDDFDAKNANLVVGGARLTFDRYLKMFHEQNINYGLNDYKKLAPARVV